MKVIDELTNYLKISKIFKIELNNGEEIEVEKWQYETDWETDSDWEVITNKEAYDKLNDEQQIQLDDLISELVIVK